jgi:hypothetical protein
VLLDKFAEQQDVFLGVFVDYNNKNDVDLAF